MLALSSSSPHQQDLKQGPVPITKQLCTHLCHCQAISAQTLDHIFRWFHLLQPPPHNGAQPPAAVSYTTLLTDQLWYNHLAFNLTLLQLIGWAHFQWNINLSIGNDIWTLDLFRTEMRGTSVTFAGTSWLLTQPTKTTSSALMTFMTVTTTLDDCGLQSSY